MIAKGVNMRVFEVNGLLAKLVEDKYVLMKELEGFENSYCINPAQADFEGYETEHTRKTNLSNIESDKLWYETENARKQFESYSSTRIMAIIACVVSVVLLLLEVIKLLSKQQ